MFSLVPFLALLWADPLPFTAVSARGAGEGVEGVDIAACLRVRTPDMSPLAGVSREGVKIEIDVDVACCPFHGGNLLRRSV
jgi:hypothetical protein